ncbi:MAG: hypothetical protein AUG44_07110 [Actinobacteria bacterium 13_1_20CM_3_71_11]|nr:MAG: hypothetical protein AUG44_07110 [Actinobacteria bacterium 13_1_20CM_3_71_11]
MPSDRTSRVIGRDPSFYPLTWTLDQGFLDKLDGILTLFDRRDLEEDLANLLPQEWQDELQERSGRDPVDLLCEALIRLSEYAGQPEVCGCLQRTVEPFGITLRVPPGVEPADDAELVELLRDAWGDDESDESDDFDDEPTGSGAEAGTAR